MSKKLYPTDVMRQAERVLDVMNQIDRNLAFDILNAEVLSSNITEAGTTLDRILSLKIELIRLRRERDEQLIALWDKVKRARVGMRSFYGDDSSEYEMVGGTRLSDRKPNTRRRG